MPSILRYVARAGPPTSGLYGSDALSACQVTFVDVDEDIDHAKGTCVRSDAHCRWHAAPGGGRPLPCRQPQPPHIWVVPCTPLTGLHPL